jgi:hypothetical protein
MQMHVTRVAGARARARPPARATGARAHARPPARDHAVNLGTLNQHQNWSLINFRKPKGFHVTATLRHLEALGVSYLAWYDSAPGGAD